MVVLSIKFLFMPWLGMHCTVFLVVNIYIILKILKTDTMTPIVFLLVNTGLFSV